MDADEPGPRRIAMPRRLENVTVGPRDEPKRWYRCYADNHGSCVGDSARVLEVVRIDDGSHWVLIKPCNDDEFFVPWSHGVLYWTPDRRDL